MSLAQFDLMKLTDEDDVLLDELSEGRCTQGYLVDETGIPRYKVHERLKMFDAASIARNIHPPTALWELLEDPRDAEDAEVAREGDEEEDDDGS